MFLQYWLLLILVFSFSSLFFLVQEQDGQGKEP